MTEIIVGLERMESLWTSRGVMDVYLRRPRIPVRVVRSWRCVVEVKCRRDSDLAVLDTLLRRTDDGQGLP